MPIYTYECQDKDCKDQLDKIMSIKDKEHQEEGARIVVCPRCGSTNMKRVWNGGHATITGIFSK